MDTVGLPAGVFTGWLPGPKQPPVHLEPMLLRRFLDRLEATVETESLILCAMNSDVQPKHAKGGAGCRLVSAL